MCQACLSYHDEPFHVLCNRELNLSCGKHRQPLKRFCEDCRESICLKCFDHQAHKTTQVNDYLFKGIIQEVIRIEDIIEANRKYKEHFKEWTDKNNELNAAYDSNFSVNSQLKQLCEVIKQTAERLGDFCNYPFTQSITALKVAKAFQLEVNKNELEKSYELLMKHLTEDYALLIEEKLQVNQHTCQCLTEQVIKEDVLALIQLQDRTFASGDAWKINLLSEAFECFKSFDAHFAWVSSIIQLKDGRLVSGGGDHMMKLWDNSTFNCIKSIQAHSNWVTALLQLKDERIASGGFEGMIKVWDALTVECLRSFQAHTCVVTALIQLEDGKLATGSADHMIKLWDVSSFECLKSFEANVNFLITSLIQLQDGRLVCGDTESMIKLWDVSTFGSPKSFKAHSRWVISLLQAKDGRLVSGGGDKMIKLWDASTFE